MMYAIVPIVQRAALLSADTPFDVQRDALLSADTPF